MRLWPRAPRHSGASFSKEVAVETLADAEAALERIERGAAEVQDQERREALLEYIGGASRGYQGAAAAALQLAPPSGRPFLARKCLPLVALFGPDRPCQKTSASPRLKRTSSIRGLMFASALTAFVYRSARNKAQNANW
jgi:hypothetical protein